MVKMKTLMKKKQDRGAKMESKIAIAISLLIKEFKNAGNVEVAPTINKTTVDSENDVESQNLLVSIKQEPTELNFSNNMEKIFYPQTNEVQNNITLSRNFQDSTFTPIIPTDILKYFNLVSQIDRIDIKNSLEDLQKKYTDKLQHFFPIVKRQDKSRITVKEGDILYKTSAISLFQSPVLPSTSNFEEDSSGKCGLSLPFERKEEEYKKKPTKPYSTMSTNGNFKGSAADLPKGAIRDPRLLIQNRREKNKKGHMQQAVAVSSMVPSQGVEMDVAELPSKRPKLSFPMLPSKSSFSASKSVSLSNSASFSRKSDFALPSKRNEKECKIKKCTKPYNTISTNGNYKESAADRPERAKQDLRLLKKTRREEDKNKVHVQQTATASSMVPSQGVAAPSKRPKHNSQTFSSKKSFPEVVPKKSRKDVPSKSKNNGGQFQTPNADSQERKQTFNLNEYKFVELNNSMEPEEQKDLVLEAVFENHIRAILVKVPNMLKEIITLITQVLFYMIYNAANQQKNSKFLIILKNDDFFYKLFECLAPHKLILAVKRNIHLPRECRNYTLHHHLQHDESVFHTLGKHTIFLTTFSSLSSDEIDLLKVAKIWNVIVCDAYLFTREEIDLPKQLNINKLILWCDREHSLGSLSRLL